MTGDSTDAAVSNRRVQQKNETRAGLIESARLLFAERGYAATRMEDIARGAGMAPATLYLHFAAKRDLALALAVELERVGSRHYVRLEEVAANPSRAAVERWVTETFETWPVTSPLTRVVEEAAVHDDAVREAMGGILEVGVTALVRGMMRAEPEVDPSTAQLHAQVAMAMHHGLFREYQHGSVRDLASITPVTVSLWETALRVSGPHSDDTTKSPS